MSWQVKSITRREITIHLEFKDPVNVSQGYSPDMLLAFMKFEMIESVKG